MKHNLKVISVMAAFFLLAQFIGLAVLYQYIDVDASIKSGKTQFRSLELAGVPVERPQVEEGSSFVYIMIALLIGTGLMLLLIRWNFTWLWKAWFGLAIALCVGLALSAFIPSVIAILIGAIAAVIKVFRPNWWVQTFTELFMYSGLAVIFVPIMNLTSAILLLVLISIYDAYAVWKSGHMIAMAKFQASQRMFAGLVLPYEGGRLSTRLPASIAQPKIAQPIEKPGVHANAKRDSRKSVKVVKQGIRTAILGGGDIGFPLIFAGVVLKSWGLASAAIIPLVAAIALVILFVKGEDGKFYPAMPILSLGCLIGLGIARIFF